MVDDGAVAGLNVHGGHIAVVSEVGRDDVAAVDIGAVGLQMVRAARLQHQIRLSEGPAVAEVRRRGQVGGVAFRRPGISPLGERCDIVIGQAARILEIAAVRVGLPGRHLPVRGPCLDVPAPGDGLRVARQRHRPDLPGPVTGLAASGQNRRDIAGVSDMG